MPSVDNNHQLLRLKCDILRSIYLRFFFPLSIAGGFFLGSDTRVLACICIIDNAGESSDERRDVTRINPRVLTSPVICRVFALRVDRSIDGAKSAKIVDVLVADLNISRRAADDHSTFEVLEFQLVALSPSVVPRARANLRDITRYYGKVKRTRVPFDKLSRLTMIFYLR